MEFFSSFANLAHKNNPAIQDGGALIAAAAGFDSK
jgi:hypothetical protein